MYIVIMGCGSVGYHLAKTMLVPGHEVLIIEKDPGLCQRVYDELGSVILNGDGTRVEVLKEAGVARADVFVAATGKDEYNLAACQMAEHLFHTPRRISLINDPQIETLFKHLGVGITINRIRLLLSAIEQQIPGPSMLYLMNIRRLNMEIVSVYIPIDAAVVGKPLSEIELPPNSLITLVVKEKGPVLPAPNVIIDADDEVVAVTTPEEEHLLYEVFTGAR